MRSTPIRAQARPPLPSKLGTAAHGAHPAPGAAWGGYASSRRPDAGRRPLQRLASKRLPQAPRRRVCSE